MYVTNRTRGARAAVEQRRQPWPVAGRDLASYRWGWTRIEFGRQMDFGKKKRTRKNNAAAEAF